jgi:reactive intermediate/imine deaminase
VLEIASVLRLLADGARIGDHVSKEPIHSKNAPAALGPYSQGVRAGSTVYLSGQVGIDPATGNLVDGIEAQAHQAFKNLRAVAQQAGGELDAVVKVTLMLADIADFARVNDVMATYFQQPYPARAAFQAAALPKAARVEVDAIMVLIPVVNASLGTGWREAFDETKGG